MITEYFTLLKDPDNHANQVSCIFSVDYSNPSAPLITQYTLNFQQQGSTGTFDTTSPGSTAEINVSSPTFIEVIIEDVSVGSVQLFLDPSLSPPVILYAPDGAPPPIVGVFFMSPSVFYAADEPLDNQFVITCFARNTLISTPTGSTPVQELKIGDLILNHQGNAVPVKWIGTQRFHPAFIPEGLPVCISAGALGGGLPLRDLFVSPGHAMYLADGVLVDAKALINGTTITQMTQWEGDVEYFHIETEHHEIILAEGAPAETFMDNVSRSCFKNYAEYEALYPNAHEMVELDIPRISHKRQLPNAIKMKLEVVATSLLGEEKMVTAA